MTTRTLICLTVFAALLFCVLSARSEGVEEGLVGYWKLNEGEGEEARDSSGMNNHGQLFGNIAWVEGKFNGALEFSEDRSCVRIEHSETVDLKGQVTLALWAKPEDLQPAWAKFLCKQKTDGYPYALQYDDSNRIKGAIYIAAEVGVKTDTFTEWGHLALVYDGTALILYKDGEEAARKSAGGELMSNDEPVTIGSRWESGQSFRGAIDDVRIYNRALSQEEIKQVMEGEIRTAVSSSGKLAAAWGMIKG